MPEHSQRPQHARTPYVPSRPCPRSHPADAAMLQLHQSVPLEGVQLPSAYVVVYLAGGQAAMADMPGNKELERVVGQAAEAGGLARLHSCVLWQHGQDTVCYGMQRSQPLLEGPVPDAHMRVKARKPQASDRTAKL